MTSPASFPLVSILLFCVTAAVHIFTVDGLLESTTVAPLLDVPTYSLATLNRDGSTNMNILTYATPVSLHPTRVWSMGLYKDTLTEENLLRKPICVLQLLTEDNHAEIVSPLGGTSGREVDKKEECAKLGMEWIDLYDDDGSGIQVLPGCSHYLKMIIQGGLIDAGSHLIVPYCEVEGMYISSPSEDSADQLPAHLSTQKLRELGIIGVWGGIQDVDRELDNRGFRIG